MKARKRPQFTRGDWLMKARGGTPGCTHGMMGMGGRPERLCFDSGNGFGKSTVQGIRLPVVHAGSRRSMVGLGWFGYTYPCKTAHCRKKCDTCSGQPYHSWALQPSGQILFS